MKLSEAIREGAKLRPQGHGAYFTIVGDRICSCAIGAAIEAVTGETFVEGIEKKNEEALYTQFIKWGLVGRNGPGFGIYSSFQWDIARMNDGSRMTREEIADILESEGK